MIVISVMDSPLDFDGKKNVLCAVFYFLNSMFSEEFTDSSVRDVFFFTRPLFLFSIKFR